MADLDLSYQGWTLPMKISEAGQDGGLVLIGTATRQAASISIEMTLVPSGGEHSIVTIRFGGRREFGIFGLTLHRTDTRGLAPYSTSAFSVGSFQNITGIEAQMMRRMFALLEGTEHVAEALAYDASQRAATRPAPTPGHTITPPPPPPRPHGEIHRIEREFGKVRCPLLCNH